MTFNINYDQDVDAVYIRIENKTVLDFEQIAEGIIIEYDQDNHAVGIELFAVKTLNSERLARLMPLLPEGFKELIAEIVPKMPSLLTI